MKIADYVSKYDPENQFDVLINSYKQIEFSWNNKVELGEMKNKNFDAVAVTGLGGSAISADLMQNFLGGELKVPFIVNRNYSLPSFINKNSLLIVSSYSGNTEETVSVLKEALECGCQIVCISTGGKVESSALEHDLPLVKILPGYQPRYALGLSFFSLLKVLQSIDLIDNQDETVKEIIQLWKTRGKEYSSEGSRAFKIAEQIIGYIPTIYSAADVTSAAGYRFKCQFNENSKMHAFQNVIPELNHNEIIGWESYDENQYKTKVLNIIDPDYHPQVKKRFEITSELASQKGVEIINLEGTGNNLKLRLMDLIYLGDWITYYAAVLRGFDPTEIDNINTLKKRLA